MRAFTAELRANGKPMIILSDVETGAHITIWVQTEKGIQVSHETKTWANHVDSTPDGRKWFNFTVAHLLD